MSVQMDSNKIQPIDKSCVHKICSGQVVLSLAVALKELVENSIDAGANLIEVKLKDFGYESVEVSDNGCGVEPKNFEGMTLKHHTSKLREFSDLSSVSTFGFRGEALSSLCSLSKLSVSTRASSQPTGTYFELDSGGTLTKMESIARQTGTTVTIKNLFYSLPVRRKEFHRNLKREFNKAVQILNAYCIISTGIKITCTNQTLKGNKSTVLATQGCATFEENIMCLFGTKQVKTLIPVEQVSPLDDEIDDSQGNNELFHLEGVVSSCAHGSGRAATDRQFYFINSRPCESPKVMRCVNEIYHQFNSHQYPFVFINVKTAKDEVDVNVTPDKRQIFINQEKLLIATIKASLSRAYEKISSTYTSICKVNPKSEAPVSKTTIVEILTSSNSNSKTVTLKREAAYANQSRPSKLIKLDDLSTSNIDSGILPELNNSTSNHDDNNAEQLPTAVDSHPLSEKPTEQQFIDDPSLHESAKSPNSVGSVSPEDIPVLEKGVDDGVRSEEETLEISQPVQVDSYVHRGKKIVEVPIDLQVIKEKIKCRAGALEHRQQVPTVLFRAPIDPTKNSDAESELRRTITHSMFEQMEIVGQFNLGFIIVKLNSDLFIVDQHASDEKFNFENLQKTVALSSQKFVVPYLLELTAANESILIDNIEIFKKNGFEFIIDPEGEPTKRVRLSAVPMSKTWVFGKEDVDELIFMLQDSPHTDCRPSRVRSMFASRACRMSVMIGKSLNMREMVRLIRQMSTMEHPWNCPHGRPTMRHLINMDLLRTDASVS